VQAVVYLTDVAGLAAMNAVYGEFFRVKPRGRPTSDVRKERRTRSR
jgi:hypothetical protein